MEEENLGDLASRVESGAVVYHSEAREGRPWTAAGVVLRLDWEEPEWEGRFFVVTPESRLIPIGELAENGGAFAIDLEADLAETLDHHLPVGHAIEARGIGVAEGALGQAEVEQLVGAIPMVPAVLPLMAEATNLQYFTFTGTCTKCAPHHPHLPSRCPQCASTSRCNW